MGELGLGGEASRTVSRPPWLGPVVHFPATPLALSVSPAPLECVWTLEGTTPVSFLSSLCPPDWPEESWVLEDFEPMTSLPVISFQVLRT